MLFGLLGKRERAPRAPLDEVPLLIYLGLDVSELLAFGFLVVIMPLLMLGTALPLLAKLLGAVAFPSWALFLFFVRREGHSASYWLAKMLPFWLRQRHFRHVRRSARPTPMLERLDEILAAEPNQLSYAWQDGADGVRELHVYENPTRPFAGWIAAEGQRLERASGRLPT